jgi:hypothetical protein
MKAAWSMLAGLAMMFALVAMVAAADEKKEEKKGGKEVTLTGTITCAKCDLKEADKCATVIKTEKDGKTVVYYFDADSHKKNHKKICTTPTKGTVKGTVSEKDGKKWVKVSDVKFD